MIQLPTLNIDQIVEHLNKELWCVVLCICSAMACGASVHGAMTCGAMTCGATICMMYDMSTMACGAMVYGARVYGTEMAKRRKELPLPMGGIQNGSNKKVTFDVGF